MNSLIKFFHSIPALYFFILFSLGIAISWYWGSFFDSTLIIGIIAFLLLLLFLLHKKNTSFFVTALIIVVLFGILRMWFALFSFTPEERNLFRNEITAVQGTIIDTRYRDDKADLYLMKCDSVFLPDTGLRADGVIGVHQGKYKGSFKYGDYVRIEQKPLVMPLPTNPGEFNFRYFFQLQDRFFSLRIEKDTKIAHIKWDQGNWAQQKFFNPVRDRIRQTINHYLPVQSAGIVNALILGDRSNLNPSVVSDFQKTGVIHVLAISGLHVGFIALIIQFSLTLMRLPARLNVILTILLLAFFVALVDFKAPVVRASLMLTTYYLTKFIKRPQDPLNVIAIAGIIILAIQPEQLLLPGFQYSFAAVFGLIYGGSRFNKIIPALKNDSRLKKFANTYIRSAFIASFCAVLATLPLTWYYYGTIQIGALIANVLVIPIIGVAVFLSIFLVGVSFVNFLPAAGIASLLHFILTFLTGIISYFAEIPFIQLTAGHPGLFMLILVTLLVMAVFNLYHKKGRQIAIAMSAILSVYLFTFSGFKDHLRLIFIHVGQGDACLIQFPNGKNALIDGGDKNFSFDAGKRYLEPVLKYYGISEINYLIGTHPHSDHIGGFEYILESYTADTLIFNELKMESKLYNRILEKAAAKNVFVKIAQQGEIIIPDAETRIYVLHPSKIVDGKNHSGKIVNNTSLILKLVHGNNSVLLNGDAEIEAEQEIMHYGSFLDCNILKVGHHGSNTSSGDLFIELSKPEIAVISVGKNNKFNHPALSTLQKYSEKGVALLRTDLNGAIVFESDGRHFQRVNWR